jgi:hypothetical protein
VVIIFDLGMATLLHSHVMTNKIIDTNYAQLSTGQNSTKEIFDTLNFACKT